MEVRISQLEPNPHRHMDNYPVNRQKVEMLKQSINQNTFWDNILARQTKDGTIQIAYGHHRLIAMQELLAEGKIKDEISLPVRPEKDINDWQMLKIMADENLGWDQSTSTIIQTVKTIRDMLQNEADKYTDGVEWKQFNKTVGVKVFSNRQSFGTAVGHTLGGGSIQKFLNGGQRKGNWKIRNLDIALAILKAQEFGQLNQKVIKLLPSLNQTGIFNKEVQAYNIPLDVQLQLAETIKAKNIRGGEISRFITKSQKLNLKPTKAKKRKTTPIKQTKVTINIDGNQFETSDYPMLFIETSNKTLVESDGTKRTFKELLIK